LKSIFQAAAAYEPAFILIVYLGIGLLPAQTERGAPIHGEVTTPSGVLPQTMLFVEVVEQGHRATNERIAVAANGNFDTRPLHPGNYEFRVVGPNGDLLGSENVTVAEFGSNATIRLQGGATQRESGGVVSLTSLQHKVPKKAHRELEKAEIALKAGDPQESIRHLQAAIAIDPDYLEAYNNLGCRLLQIGKAEEAVNALDKAVELDPKAPFTLANLSAALLVTKDASGAEAAARRALQVDPSSVRAHYLLGLSLFYAKKYTPETVQNFRQAAEQFPKAKTILNALENRSKGQRMPVAVLVQ
jgi:tetratricopeptide (TPR) repeat protein